MYPLEYQIELLRCHLAQEVKTIGSFTDERIVQLSQQLDKLIVEYQKSKVLSVSAEASCPNF